MLFTKFAITFNLSDFMPPFESKRHYNFVPFINPVFWLPLRQFVEVSAYVYSIKICSHTI